MITLDAGVLIALLDANDAHHETADSLIRAHLADDMFISPLNLAEVLVKAVQQGRDAQLMDDITSLGVRAVSLPDDAPLRLARLRAQLRLKLPDCCVLLADEQTGAPIASFNQRLRSAPTEARRIRADRSHRPCNP
ncbi:Predicted nucleic acid-binding protein, contains PIN domain [Tessaracoccus bendigoensis DSM 12906]|uniref:Predicted nucleic acid-binding protein, contains PIN domain n=1 Tax=Tessaracoccus bendigoensis DSM 12906 TaxID=1123357 RepID=A0A1M6NJA1_9ACTN|nr:PIN domain-containing protein [Tessaracoccus bendigoensis]SHJ95777.1 Predicted nucleic acid-binding protein, contains PIN domain [Tessaracoccus bendigoensis DSM 12906]